MHKLAVGRTRGNGHPRDTSGGNLVLVRRLMSILQACCEYNTITISVLGREKNYLFYIPTYSFVNVHVTSVVGKVAIDTLTPIGRCRDDGLTAPRGFEHSILTVALFTSSHCFYP